MSLLLTVSTVAQQLCNSYQGCLLLLTVHPYLMFSLCLLLQVSKNEKRISHDFLGQETPAGTASSADVLFASNRTVTISIHFHNIGLITKIA